MAPTTRAAPATQAGTVAPCPLGCHLRDTPPTLAGERARTRPPPPRRQTRPGQGPTILAPRTRVSASTFAVLKKLEQPCYGCGNSSVHSEDYSVEHQTYVHVSSEPGCMRSARARCRSPPGRPAPAPSPGPRNGSQTELAKDCGLSCQR